VSPRPEVVVGLGTRTGADPAVVLELLDRALSECRVTRADVVAVATVDARAGEPALTQLAALLAVPLLSYPAEQLNRVAVPTPSTRVAELAATASVAEAAALMQKMQVFLKAKNFDEVEKTVDSILKMMGVSAP